MTREELLVELAGLVCDITYEEFEQLVAEFKLQQGGI